MGIYVTSKCPRCKYVFEFMEPSWVDFGDPRIKCPKCGLIVIFKNIKEWKLRHPLQKLGIIFTNYTFHNLVPTSGILILLLILLALFPKIWGSSYTELISPIETPFWVITGSIVFLIIAYFRHKRFAQAIRESNKRMENKQYADQMRKLY